MNIDRLIANTLDAALDEQPWAQRNANTVVAIASAIATLGTWLTATYTDVLPRPVVVVVGTLVAVATIIATKRTPNGITPRGNQKIEQVIANELGHYVAQARETAAEYADPITAAVQRGFSEHDPRYLGMTLDQAARAFLDNLRTP